MYLFEGALHVTDTKSYHRVDVIRRRRELCTLASLGVSVVVILVLLNAQVETSVGFIGYCSHLLKETCMKVADKPGQAHPNVSENPDLQRCSCKVEP